MSVNDGERAGQGSFGKIKGIVLDSTMPTMRHGTKSGSLIPNSVIGLCTKYPMTTATLTMSRAYIKFDLSIVTAPTSAAVVSVPAAAIPVTSF